jgi:hypothetical protein
MGVRRLSIWGVVGRICFIRRRILGIRIIDELFNQSYDHDGMSEDESGEHQARADGTRAIGLRRKDTKICEGCAMRSLSIQRLSHAADF